jgi:tetratricopeptide (TPR) repeat protein
MSPEQAEMTAEGVDTRTDVYSLGVLLYQLLVGTLPFDSKELRKAGFDEIRRKIREEVPSRPSGKITTLGDASTEAAERRQTDLTALRKQLRGDLDWITMKALEKDRARRYESPNELAADVRRHLNEEPVQACPPSTTYRMGKFVRRHKLGAVAATVLVLGLTSGIVGSSVGLIRARRAEARALEEARKAERVSQFLTDALGDVDPVRAGRALYGDLRERVAEARRTRGGSEEEVRATLASFDEAMVEVSATDAGMQLLDEEILGRVKARIESELGDDPDIAGRLYHTIGMVYNSLGRDLQTIEMLERALVFRRRSLGDDHLDTLTSMSELALVSWRVGREDDHFQLVSEVVERGRRVLGEEHPLVIDNLLEVADAYMYGDHGKDRVAEGQTRHIEMLEAKRRVLGEEHRSTLYSMDRVAQILVDQNRWDEAESLYREALEVKRRVLGDEDRSTLGTKVNLAVLQGNRGRLDEAETVYRETMEIGRRVFGEASSLTWMPMNNMALICTLQGRYDDAERWWRRVLEIHRRWRADSDQTLFAMSALADVLVRQGHDGEAKALYDECLAAARRRESQTIEAYLLLGLARLYLAQGELAKADFQFQQSLRLDSDRPWLFMDRARYQVLIGDHEATILSLSKAVDLGQPRAWVAIDPDFVPLHGTPEFEAIVAEVKRQVGEE